MTDYERGRDDERREIVTHLLLWATRTETDRTPLSKAGRQMLTLSAQVLREAAASVGERKPDAP